MARPAKIEWTDELLFSAIEMLANGMSASEIAEKLQKELGDPSFTREQVYPLVRKARDRDLLVLKPPSDTQLAKQLTESYKLPPDSISVVKVRGNSVLNHLAKSTAELVKSLILDLKKRGINPVHVALGSGRTTHLVCHYLGELLRADSNRPDLVFHALTGGWDPSSALDSPVAHFGHFYFVDQEYPSINFVGLSAPPIVPADQFNTIRQLPFIEECFKQAAEVDIVISSIGSKDDEHSYLTRAMELEWVKKTGQKREMEKDGWIGDVQFLPYSKSGTVQGGKGKGLKAFVIVTLEDLVKMASTRDKYVVLVAGPCGKCRKTKTAALQPLLEVRELRVFTHLIVDIATAEELRDNGKDVKKE